MLSFKLKISVRLHKIITGTLFYPKYVIWEENQVILSKCQLWYNAEQVSKFDP